MALTPSARLISCGFVKKDAKDKYPKDEKELKAFLEKASSGDLEKDAEQDEIEVGKDQLMLFPYPKPDNKYYLVYESYQNAIEPIYYWSLGHLQYDLGFPIIDKITDIFAASEQSSFYGAAGQRLGLAQDKASQLLAQIGQFIRRDLFQLVRDIRWIEERVKIHDDARSKDKKLAESGEITLKGLWSDIVDGVVQGQRVHANIFQMAQQLQFTALPDLFFKFHPKTSEDIGKVVDPIGTTTVVKNVLKRKLEEFLVWKNANYEELKQRKRFELNYLRQHYNIIKMYMQWLKPYLRVIERMSAETSKLGKPELITAFEGSMVEIEILARRIPTDVKDIFSCILMTFEYRTKPSLQFQVEAGFHRGPIHIGETKITWRAYAWNEDDIRKFQKFKEREDFAMLAKFDTTIEETMNSIGDDLEKYLKDAGEVIEDKPKEEPKKEQKGPGVFEPISALFGGFKELFWDPFFPKKETKKEAKVDKEKSDKDKDAAKKDARKMLWTHYKNFKKAHGMYSW